jgi:hypothetical protein
VPFRPKDTGAANYEVVERKYHSNANDVKQDSQETALYSIVDKTSSGKYANSKVFFYLGVQKMLLLAKYKNESCYFLKVHEVLS